MGHDAEQHRHGEASTQERLAFWVRVRRAAYTVTGGLPGRWAHGRVQTVHHKEVALKPMDPLTSVPPVS